MREVEQNLYAIYAFGEINKLFYISGNYKDNSILFDENIVYSRKFTLPSDAASFIDAVGPQSIDAVGPQPVPLRVCFLEVLRENLNPLALPANHASFPVMNPDIIHRLPEPTNGFLLAHPNQKFLIVSDLETGQEIASYYSEMCDAIRSWGPPAPEAMHEWWNPF